MIVSKYLESTIIFTARFYAKSGIATAIVCLFVRLSLCDVEVYTLITYVKTGLLQKLFFTAD